MNGLHTLLQIQKFIPSICKFFLAFLFTIAATAQEETERNQSEVSHSIYLISNTGNTSDQNRSELFKNIVAASQKDKSASLLLIGNITSEKGYPDKDNGREKTNQFLQEELLNPLKDFNGNLIFTPGENEWKKDAPDNIDDLESFLQDNSEAEFWPNDGCPIEGESLSDDVELVMVDSQWYLEDWDKHPYINNKCEYKTREQFFIEFKDELKDNQGKTILVAIHHPVRSQTKRSFFDKTIGAGIQSFQNPDYKDLRGRLETLASQFNDVIFVSGHENNLQYIQDDDTHQIISGTTDKIQKAKPEKDKGDVAYYQQGYAKLSVFKDGSSLVQFFETTANGPKMLGSKQIKKERLNIEDVEWKTKDEFGKTKMASVYTEEETDKDGLYKFLWGEHYRPLFSRKIEFPVLFLDTIPGNLKAISEGGGKQSRSLRLIDDDDHEYTLRAIKKSSIRFLQATVVKDHYVSDYLRNTVADRYVQDFYTTAHPYAPFAVNGLMDALEIDHAQPKIYYIPKQKTLGIYNEDYGDALYMLEEHVGDENKDLEIFGEPDDIISSHDLLLETQKTKKVYADEDLFIRARLLDMLIGDWDRHEDQWRWAEFEDENGNKRYAPIPRDRDQAFPRFDGPILSLLKIGAPAFRAMETYDDKVDNPKWFNIAGYPLDKALIKKSTWEDWERQVKYIQENITNKVVEESFAVLPEGAQDESIANIKKSLEARKGNLMEIAREYYDYLNEFETILGTKEDDQFLITRKKGGITAVQISSEGDVVFQKEYNSNLTKDIWFYGLDGDDEFKIVGKGDNLIKLKVIGGEENDIYDFQNTRRAKLYDYKSKDNTIKTPNAKKWLVDSYEINNYDPKKKKSSRNIILPSLDFSSDIGFKLGAKDVFTTYGLARNPFTTQHTITANYFFETEGFDVSYFGEFAHAFYKWNLGIDAYYSSPNFTMNYFGEGNGTEYDDDDVDRDFNRVRIQQWHFAPSLIFKKNQKSSFYIKGLLESFEVSNDDDQFVGQAFQDENDVFESQLYAGGEINYNYLNKEYLGFPSQGVELDFTAGYKVNIDDHDNQFAYVRPIFSINYPLHESGIATLATKVGGEAILGDNYEFYHGALLGGNNENSLRGYRNDRFNGKYTFAQNIDLRVGLTQFKTNFVPIRLGVSAGFDYGRVWLEDDNSEQWHNNAGGSVFLNAFNAFTANIGYYVGDEGGRLNFKLGFTF